MRFNSFFSLLGLAGAKAGGCRSQAILGLLCGSRLYVSGMTMGFHIAWQ